MGLIEILLLAALGYVLFNSNKLSELGKSIGKAGRNFKESINEIDVDETDIKDDPELIERQKKFQNKTKKD